MQSFEKIWNMNGTVSLLQCSRLIKNLASHDSFNKLKPVLIMATFVPSIVTLPIFMATGTRIGQKIVYFNIVKKYSVFFTLCRKSILISRMQNIRPNQEAALLCATALMSCSAYSTSNIR